jgi:hypothetical protein
MHLVEVLLRAYFETEYYRDDGEHIDKGQFPEISGKVDNKSHDQKIGEIQQVFPCS